MKKALIFCMVILTLTLFGCTTGAVRCINGPDGSYFSVTESELIEMLNEKIENNGMECLSYQEDIEDFAVYASQEQKYIEFHLKTNENDYITEICIDFILSPYSEEDVETFGVYTGALLSFLTRNTETALLISDELQIEESFSQSSAYETYEKDGISYTYNLSWFEMDRYYRIYYIIGSLRVVPAA